MSNVRLMRTGALKENVVRIVTNFLFVFAGALAGGIEESELSSLMLAHFGC